MRTMIEQQAQAEATIREQNLQITLVKEMEKLSVKQQQSLQSLLKRIQRDREEQVKHR